LPAVGRWTPRSAFARQIPLNENAVVEALTSLVEKQLVVIGAHRVVAGHPPLYYPPTQLGTLPREGRRFPVAHQL